jgi:cell division protein FtsQ
MRERVSEKILKRILVAVAILLGAELLWLFGLRPCMPLERITVEGIPNADRDALLAAAGIVEHSSSFITVDRNAAEAALVSLPLVESAKVLKSFPSGLDIILTPRRPAAAVLFEAGGKTIPALVGDDGVVFSVGKTGLSENDTAPVLSGITLENPAPGTKVSRVYSRLFRQLGELAESSPELLRMVSEIRVNEKNYEGYDLTLYPAHYPVRIRLSADLSREKLSYALLFLDVLKNGPEEIEEIDCRTGTASYMVKEAPTG